MNSEDMTSSKASSRDEDEDQDKESPTLSADASDDSSTKSNKGKKAVVVISIETIDEDSRVVKYGLRIIRIAEEGLYLHLAFHLANSCNDSNNTHHLL
jgi:hypothetical protein